MKAEDADRVAAQIAALSSESGLGFLLATVAVEGIVDGTLDPADLRFDELLRTHAYELLLSAAGEEGESAPEPALVQALALAPEPGLPIGDAWRAMAEALDKRVDAGVEAQLRTLEHFGRFVIEHQHEGEPVFRWFHESLREALREQVGGVASEPSRRAVGALLDLRARRTDGSGEMRRAGWFLSESLPRMAVASEDSGLIEGALRDASEEEARQLVLAMLAAAADRRAVGDWTAASRLAQRSLLLTAGRGDTVTALAMLGQAEAITLDYDLWRDGRDMSRSTLELAERLLVEEPDRPDLLELLVRATRTLARTLGIGAFDAHEGLEHIDRTLRRVAAADPTELAALAPFIAEMLQAYNDSLSYVTAPSVKVESAAASARIRARLIGAGREDLRLAHGESLAYAWMAGEELGDPGGLEPLARSLASLFAVTPTPAHWVLPLTWMVGEPVQALGFAGREEEALGLLNHAIQAFEPSVRGAERTEGFPFGLASLLGSRSAVLTALGRPDDALLDARQGVGIAHVFEESGESRAIPCLVLALRMLERGRDDLALGVLEVEARSERVAKLLAAARGMAEGCLAKRSERGDPEAAIGSLSAALDLLDPDVPQPAPRNSEDLFVSFGLELLIGRELDDALALADRAGEVAEGSLRAATIFLRNQVLASPARLIHLEPGLRRHALPYLRLALERDAELASVARSWLEATQLLQEREPSAELLAELARHPSASPGLETADGWQLDAAYRETDWPARAVARIEERLAIGLRQQASGAPPSLPA